MHIDSDCKEFGPHSSSAADKRDPVVHALSSKKKDATIAPIFTQGKIKPPQQSTQPQVGSSSSYAGSSTPHKRRAEDNVGPSIAGQAKKLKPMVTRSAKMAAAAPLAERLRPQSLEEFVGQPHLIGSESLLMNLIRNGSMGSMIFWGPPG